MSSWESKIATTSEFKNGISLNKPFALSASLRLKKNQIENFKWRRSSKTKYSYRNE